MMINFLNKHTDLTSLAQQVCLVAKTSGFTDARVYLNYWDGHDISIHNNTVSALEKRSGYSLGVTLYEHKKSIAFSTSDIRIETITAHVITLKKRIQYLEADPFSGLADRSELAYEMQDLDLYHTWSQALSDQINIVKGCEDIALTVNAKILSSDKTQLSCGQSMQIYANTNDFIAYYPSTYYNLSCSLIAKPQNLDMQTDYDYFLSRKSPLEQDIIDLAYATSSKVLARVGAKPLPSQSCRVLFAPAAAKTLLRIFTSAISGSQIYRKASFLADKINQQVFATHVNIVDDPTILMAMGSSYCDAEGVKTRKRNLIENGRLTGYLLGSYTARQLGMETTGNAGGYHNIVCQGDGGNEEDMLSHLDTGLYVTEFIGQGVNLVTGDLSKGVCGFWVEKGVIQFPVNATTVAGNLIDIFHNVSSIGSVMDIRGAIHTGAWLVNALTVAGS